MSRKFHSFLKSFKDVNSSKYESRIHQLSRASGIRLGYTRLDIPMLEPLENSKEYLLGVPYKDTWALYHKSDLVCPIISFVFKTHEIFPSKQVTYQHKKMLKKRNRHLNIDYEKSLKDIVLHEIRNFNREKISKIPLQNYYETLYIDDIDENEENLRNYNDSVDEDIEDDDIVLSINETNFNVNQAIEDKFQNFQTSVRDYLKESNFQSNKAPQHIKNHFTKVKEFNLLRNQSEQVFNEFVKRDRLNNEIKEKVSLIEDESDVSTFNCGDNIKITACLPKVNPNLPFISKENEWFGFKINPSFYFLLRSNNINEKVLNIRSTSDIQTAGDYLLVYTTLLKICSVTRSKQFIRFCNSFLPSLVYKSYIADPLFNKSISLFMNGIYLNSYNYVYLLTKFSQIINKPKLLLAHLNLLPKFFDRDEWWFDIRYMSYYNYITAVQNTNRFTGLKEFNAD